MNTIRKIGLLLLIAGIVLFTASLFLSDFRADRSAIESVLNEKEQQHLLDPLTDVLTSTEASSAFALSKTIRSTYTAVNDSLRKSEKWDEVMYAEPRELASRIARASVTGTVAENRGLWLFLTFGLAIIGGLMFILPNVVLKPHPGIKNDHVFQSKATARGWIGWIVFGWLVGFYILLYFYPDLTISWALIADSVSQWIKGQPGDRWFLYGLMYCTVMVVMGIRMFVKYRGNKYQTLRTASVVFFQVCFAFLIPELMMRFNMPAMDFKNIWPLDYDFFFSWNIDQKLQAGTLGLFMMIWGTLLIIVAVPVFVYFFGKRWYCSWVCGCGGLAETLGDPYRQLSDKSLKAWKIERWLIHGVLVFAVVMTGLTLYTYFSGASQVWFADTYDIQKTYGFLIGSVFAGVIGTGFYPVMGSRVWCRFGCPLAAYLGLVQRFKSRFRITTNGGQCISCGNCSTYCEMGIDVRWYAQRGQNIVRSSCVGCGICSAVCPRGVLKLENGPEEGRISDDPILIGREGVRLNGSVIGDRRG